MQPSMQYALITHWPITAWVVNQMNVAGPPPGPATTPINGHKLLLVAVARVAKLMFTFSNTGALANQLRAHAFFAHSLSESIAAFKSTPVPSLWSTFPSS